jgi:transitional endoplasmic reticulum ATPase
MRGFKPRPFHNQAFLVCPTIIVDGKALKVSHGSSDSHRSGEVLVVFEELVVARDGTGYYAHACGGRAGDRTERWHGWVEFAPVEGGPVIRTPRETTQPDRANTARWARGLRPAYLEGALGRALHWGLIADQPSSPLTPAPETPSRRAAPRLKSVRKPAHQRLRPREPGAERTPPRTQSTGPPATGFARVGGMDDLKSQIRRIVETVHVRQEDARRYGIVRNGILLYGPPGSGKTFFAQAMAEEFGLRLLRVPLESAISKYVGGAPDAIQGLFHEARSKAPCLLFFDEFDAIASKRQDTPNLHEQQMVNALLQQLDAYRETPGLLIVAATNRFEDLDPAVIREGRFDYKVKIHNPDLDARLAILRTLVSGRPHGRRLRLAELAQNLEGFSAAQIRSLIDEAALAALEAGQPIRDEHLSAAYRTHVAASRYGGVKLGWDELILPVDTKRKLQLIEQVIENPQVVRQLGITPPSGILMFGPPGTGKTTIARVLASETEASFFSVNAADIFSKWLGESEQRVKELFARARARVPAIIFIDEIDSITERRGEGDSGGDRVRNAVVNMFLAEMDGLDSSTRVFVIGASNRPELLDEALLRPGRLGERIEIPLPDTAGRKAMLELFSKKMRLAPSVDLESLAVQTEGKSGAVLKGLCTLAGRNALVRELDARGIAPEVADVAPAVTQEDFEKAFRELASPPRRRPVGFNPPEETQSQ